MRNLIPGWIRVPAVFFIIFGLTEYFIDSGEKPAFIEYPVIMLFLALVLLILLAIEGIVYALENVLYQSLDEAGKARYDAKRNKIPQFTWFKNTYKKLVGTKPIEEEHEIILDHNYDGIKELDNNLPPWWLYGFYASIIFGAVYLVKYHVFNGDNQYTELSNEIVEAELEKAKYLKNAKDLVDYKTVKLLTDAGDLAKGKTIFNANCVACHMADGGGGVGPNLTDKYWVLGGGISNVFKTISEGGRSGKGMIAWKQNFKPSEIAQVASYLLTLEGTTPANPKKPEGEIWEDTSKEDNPETESKIEIEVKVETN